MLVIVLAWPWFAWIWMQEYRSWRRERERLRLEDIVEDLKKREDSNPRSGEEV